VNQRKESTVIMQHQGLAPPTKVVDSDLHFKSVRCLSVWNGHDASVVDEDVELGLACVNTFIDPASINQSINESIAS
jgi:hypothetical protein